MWKILLAKEEERESGETGQGKEKKIKEAILQFDQI